MSKAKAREPYTKETPPQRTEHEATWDTYLQKRVLSLEADLSETARIKNLFGQALSNLGVTKVNDDGGIEAIHCVKCGHPKARHDKENRCPDFASKRVKTSFQG